MRIKMPGTLLLAVALTMPAIADDTDPESAQTMSHVDEQSAEETVSSGQIIAAALAESPDAKQATRIELTIQCEQYVLALTVFDDGTFKATDMQNEPVDRTELASAQAMLPILKVIDIGCEDD